MPKLIKSDKHECFMCKNILSQRHHLKRHLTSIKSNGKPRCPGLTKVIPSDFWDQQIFLYYTKDAALPLPKLSGLSQYKKKKRGPARSPLSKLQPTSRRRRLSHDNALTINK